MDNAVAVMICALCIVFVVGNWPIYLCPGTKTLVDQSCVQEIKDSIKSIGKEQTK